MTPVTGPTILMCPPTYFGIEYEINPWMDTSQQADVLTAKTQWNDFHQLLMDLGVTIPLLEPVEHLPDLVFTANAGMVFRDKVFLARFRHAVRQKEVSTDRNWFQQAGFEVIELPDGRYFEGAGDALFCGDTLFAGYLTRSDAVAMQWVAEQIGCRVIPLQLVDPRFYHIDTCFCPLDAESALYYRPAFDSYGQRALKEGVHNLIEVSEAEAIRFACNAVVVGKNVILNTGCPEVMQELNSRGYRVQATDLDQFLKAGGSAKCLTLRLDGEEAAHWKNAD